MLTQRSPSQSPTSPPTPVSPDRGAALMAASDAVRRALLGGVRSPSAARWRHAIESAAVESAAVESAAVESAAAVSPQRFRSDAAAVSPQRLRPAESSADGVEATPRGTRLRAEAEGAQRAAVGAGSRVQGAAGARWSRAEAGARQKEIEAETSEGEAAELEALEAAERAVAAEVGLRSRVCIYPSIYTYVYVYMHAVCSCTCACTHAHTHTCTHAHMHTCTHPYAGGGPQSRVASQRPRGDQDRQV